MLSKHEDRIEREQVLRNDARVREQERTGTYLSHTHPNEGGRYAAAMGEQVIVGQSPDPWPKLPASSPWAGPDLVGDEPPLPPDSNPALEPSSDDEAQATGPTPQPLAPLGEARVGPFSSDMAAQCRSQMSSSTRPDDDDGIERPPTYKFTRRV
jgi:hypothetical protein